VDIGKGCAKRVAQIERYDDRPDCEEKLRLGDYLNFCPACFTSRKTPLATSVKVSLDTRRNAPDVGGLVIR
jgi:hypothetical protein